MLTRWTWPLLAGFAWVCSACASDSGGYSNNVRKGFNAAGKAGTETGSAGKTADPGGSPAVSGADNPVLVLKEPDVAGTGSGAMAAGSGGAAGATPDSGPAECDAMFCRDESPDGVDCGSATLKSSVKVVETIEEMPVEELIEIPGNIMVIFDRSTSMEMAWNGTPRYQAVGDAFVNAIMPLQQQLTVGAIFFPSPTVRSNATPNCPDGCNIVDFTHWIPGFPGCCLDPAVLVNGLQACDVNPISAMDQIQFGPATTFISTAPTKWRFNGLLAQGAMGLVGATPLGAGVARAAEAIDGKMFNGPLVVVILTDGEPNCDTNQDMVLTQVKNWHMKNISTYVIGIPGAQAAEDVLNALAAAGGTNTYLNPATANELQMKLSMILQSTVTKIVKKTVKMTVKTGIDSCSIKLEHPAEVPDKLQLAVTTNGVEVGIPRDLSGMQGWPDGSGWTINAAGDMVELKGRLCDLAKDGTYDKLRFVYGCKPLPPPPPPPPPPVIN